MTLTLIALGALIVGYTLGRYRPAHRVSDWANWQNYGRRPTGLRYAAVYVVLSAENLTWLALHPIQGAQAWKQRNDPPPHRGPAVEIRRLTIPDHRVNEEQEA